MSGSNFFISRVWYHIYLNDILPSLPWELFIQNGGRGESDPTWKIFLPTQDIHSLIWECSLIEMHNVCLAFVWPRFSLRLCLKVILLILYLLGQAIYSLCGDLSPTYTSQYSSSSGISLGLWLPPTKRGSSDSLWHAFRAPIEGIFWMVIWWCSCSELQTELCRLQERAPQAVQDCRCWFRNL